MADYYRDAMLGIQDKVAMMAIRKIIRGKLSEKEKLEEILCVVDEYRYDMRNEKDDAK